jgi:predicted 3-demethylubiquinone-9 3-methyltransferase (glyoxalase superfamily)
MVLAVSILELDRTSRTLFHRESKALQKVIGLYPSYLGRKEGFKKNLVTTSVMQKITPFLWFDGKAEEAAKFYTSVFKNSKIGKIARYGKEGYEVHQKPAGTVMTVEFEIDGQKFVALNAGPEFKFNEAVSFAVDCKSQEEVDTYWKKLTEGGEESVCGWLKDKYGLSWQITPTVLGEMLADKNPEKAGRVMAAMLKMKKIDIATLKKAYDQR